MPHTYGVIGIITLLQSIQNGSGMVTQTNHYTKSGKETEKLEPLTTSALSVHKSITYPCEYAALRATLDPNSKTTHMTSTTMDLHPKRKGTMERKVIRLRVNSMEKQLQEQLRNYQTVITAKSEERDDSTRERHCNKRISKINVVTPRPSTGKHAIHDIMLILCIMGIGGMIALTILAKRISYGKGSATFNIALLLFFPSQGWAQGNDNNSTTTVANDNRSTTENKVIRHVIIILWIMGVCVMVAMAVLTRRKKGRRESTVIK